MNYSLKLLNTFGILQYANKIVYAENVKQILDAWQSASKYNLPVIIIGNGSNILFVENFTGTVIVNRIMGIKITESKNGWHLHIGAGENWDNLVRFTIKQNMPGLENLAFIPGSVGASPIQNIGAYGIEFKDVCEYVEYVELITGKLIRLNTKECYFNYRDSIFKHKFKGKIAIIAVGIYLRKLWKPTLTYGNLINLNPNTVTPRKIFNTIFHIRISKLPNPKIYGNAGSFFKNPIIHKKIYKKITSKHLDKFYFYYSSSKNKYLKLNASWLIDKCQLKNTVYGGASIYKNQAVVLINENNATSKDIILLAQYIRQQVGKKFNIWLEPEVNFIGRIGEINAVETIS